jgi:hypothetical protein
VVRKASTPLSPTAAAPPPPPAAKDASAESASGALFPSKNRRACRRGQERGEVEGERKRREKG